MEVKTRRNLSLLLSAVSIVGLAGTAISAALDSKKAEDAKRAKELREKRCLTKEEEIIVKAPKYIRTAAFGVCTAGCIVGAAILDDKNYKTMAPIAAAYPVLEKQYYRFVEATKTIAGEETYHRIMDEITVAERDHEDIWVPGLAGVFQSVDKNTENPEVKRIFYDVFSDTTFESTLAEVIDAQYHFNRNVGLGMYPAVLYYYDLLGFDITDPKYRKYNGLSWNGLYEDGIFWIDFNNVMTILDDGSEIVRTGFVWDPDEDEEALIDFEEWAS